MLTNYAERYVLRSCSAGGYLGVNTVDQRIEPKRPLTKPGFFTPMTVP